MEKFLTALLRILEGHMSLVYTGILFFIVTMFFVLLTILLYKRSIFFEMSFSKLVIISIIIALPIFILNSIIVTLIHFEIQIFNDQKIELSWKNRKEVVKKFQKIETDLKKENLANDLDEFEKSLRQSNYNKIREKVNKIKKQITLNQERTNGDDLDVIMQKYQELNKQFNNEIVGLYDIKISVLLYIFTSVLLYLLLYAELVIFYLLGCKFEDFIKLLIFTLYFSLIISYNLYPFNFSLELTGNEISLIKYSKYLLSGFGWLFLIYVINDLDNVSKLNIYNCVIFVLSIIIYPLTFRFLRYNFLNYSIVILTVLYSNKIFREKIKDLIHHDFIQKNIKKLKLIYQEVKS